MNSLRPLGLLLLSSTLLSLAGANLLAQTTPDWVQLAPSTSPSARSYLTMAYDGVTGKIVLFGGVSGSQYFQDTWTFDGATWVKLNPPTSPPARANGQMAYDHRNRKIVLFGGYNGHSYLGDTWLWDGSTQSWSQASAVHSPTAVTGPMVFNDLNGLVDEYGGFDGRFYQLTMWRWSGTDWRQLHPPQVPTARSVSAVGVNYHLRQTVLYGGLADLNPLNTWILQDQTWTELTLTLQPATVYAASAVFEPRLDAVILFGGGNGGIDQNGTWSWDGSSWSQLLTAHSPEAREGFGMAYDDALHRIVIFGGQDRSVPLGDTWELQP